MILKLKTLTAIPRARHLYSRRSSWMGGRILTVAFALLFVSLSTAQTTFDEAKALSSERFASVTVEHGGAVTTVTSRGETASQLLDRLNISCTWISVPTGYAVGNGDVIIASQNVTSTIEQDSEIPYETVRVESPDLYEGSETVATAGSSGTLRLTYRVVASPDGEVLSSELLSETVVTQPVNEIVKYGTKKKTSYVIGGDGSFTASDGTVFAYSKALRCTATAYTTELQSNKITFSGTVARIGAVAVDPRVIPLGSTLYIAYPDGSCAYGYATAEDTGALIKGNIVDIFLSTNQECVQWGRRAVTVYILKN